MELLDWIIVGVFAISLVAIAIITNRMTKSVAGFLSSERSAGRYLLTIAQSMAFLSAIGMVGGFEGYYRNGIGGMWWGMLMMPVGIIIALSGWVAYRYRQTRAMTMAQFLEMRYSKKFRIFAGLIAFFSGVLNCAVFPMVTANFLIYFLGLPMSFDFLGMAVPMYQTVMFVMIGAAVLLAIAGGQNTIMVTSFFQGAVTSAALLGCLIFTVVHFGWTGIMDTLTNSEKFGTQKDIGPEWFFEKENIQQQLVSAEVDFTETLKAHPEAIDSLIAAPENFIQSEAASALNFKPATLQLMVSDPDATLSLSRMGENTYPDMIGRLDRPKGVSMINPFKQGGLPDFGPAFFIMMTILFVAKTGVWQGGSGFMTAAKSAHEAKMGNILGSWRWLLITLGTIGIVIACYTLLWNPAYAEQQSAIKDIISQIPDKHIQSQMFIPVILREMLPAGLLGLFAIFMIGSAVSTDDSAYHSWGTIFLQDVVLPFRKTPFSTEAHLKWLRWSIVLIGAISFWFSSVFTMKEFINMWFEITGAIYIGGASCAIIGGLYWSRGTTSAAWSGLITGSTISVASIVIKQIWPDLTFPWNDTVINGIHMAVFAVAVSYVVYISVSLVTCKQKFNMDQLLHRGKYAVEEAEKEKEAKKEKGDSIPWILRKIGITNEFNKRDTVVYVIMTLWTAGWTLTFVIGTIYNLTIRELTTDEWRFWWTLMLGIQAVVSLVSAVWFTIGGFWDCSYLFKKLANLEVNELDDGTVHGHHSAADESEGIPTDD